MKQPKRLGSLTQSRAYNRAPAQEREAAGRLGGRTTPASGSLREKGDVRVSGILRLECKATAKKSFSVTRDMVRKITEAGELSGEIPAVEIEFLPVSGQFHGRVAVVPVYVLNQLVAAEKHHG